MIIINNKIRVLKVHQQPYFYKNCLELSFKNTVSQKLFIVVLVQFLNMCLIFRSKVSTKMLGKSRYKGWELYFLQRRKIGYTQLLSLRNFHSLRDYWWFSDISYIFLSHLIALNIFFFFYIFAESNI